MRHIITTQANCDYGDTVEVIVSHWINKSISLWLDLSNAWNATPFVEIMWSSISKHGKGQFLFCKLIKINDFDYELLCVSAETRGWGYKQSVASVYQADYYHRKCMDLNILEYFYVPLLFLLYKKKNLGLWYIMQVYYSQTSNSAKKDIKELQENLTNIAWQHIF